MGHREHGGLCPPFHAELAQNGRDVVLHGLLRQGHGHTDLAVRETPRDVVENSSLLRREQPKPRIRVSVVGPPLATRSTVPASINRSPAATARTASISPFPLMSLSR